MSTLTDSQRGDLAEQMLPVAAHLAVLVHGDGGPEDIAEVLAGLDETQKNALIVVLAGMVDPDQPVGKGLGWTAVTKNGALPVSAWMEQRPLRGHAPDTAEELDEDFVDQAAVTKFVKGFRVQVTEAEFLAAVQQCAAKGMTLGDINQLRRWPAKTAENLVYRLRKRYQRAGRTFPDLGLIQHRVFTEDEVVAIRQRAADGATHMELAMAFGTSAKTIGGICRGQTYPQYGGPIREGRGARGARASREFMCGHGDGSRASRNQSDMEEAA